MGPGVMGGLAELVLIGSFLALALIHYLTDRERVRVQGENRRLQAQLNQRGPSDGSTLR